MEGVSLLFVIGVVLLSLGMVGGGLALSRWLAPHLPGKIKSSPYECGEVPIGPAQVQFNVAYYVFALLFLVFDVESVFLFPWAVVVRQAGLLGLVEIGLFVLILVAGLAYAYKKGALEWHS